jgi:hypothetical protein
MTPGIAIDAIRAVLARVTEEGVAKATAALGDRRDARNEAHIIASLSNVRQTTALLLVKLPRYPDFDKTKMSLRPRCDL